MHATKNKCLSQSGKKAFVKKAHILIKDLSVIDLDYYTTLPYYQ